MNKLLVICGPTATGKTRLALVLAKKFNGEIISADSRQVYRGLDIGTGKDLPVNSKFKTVSSGYGYYEIKGVKIWGYDLADPKHDFSVSQFVKFAKKKITEIQEDKKLPILVGGTGFYIKAIIDGIPTVDVPQNKKLRETLVTKSTDELYENLSQMDPVKAGSMNASDKRNPRRLIRAIEVAQYLIDHHLPSRKVQDSNIVFIGLVSSMGDLEQKIAQRIQARLKAGIKEEISSLLESGVRWEDQSMMSLGYRQWRDYFEGALNEKETVEEWTREEKKYAKRQITWFKKDKRINWFDFNDAGYPENVEKLVKKWDNSANHAS